MTEETSSDNLFYNYLFPLIGDSIKKYVKPLVLPLIVGGALAYGAYQGLNYLSDEKIIINPLEGKTYVTVSQRGLFDTTTDIQKDGRIGKTLEQIENDEIKDENDVYQLQIDRVNNRLDGIIKNAENEARNAWNDSKPKPVIEITEYHQNLQTLGEERKKIRGTQ